MSKEHSSVSRRSLFTTQLGSLVALLLVPQLVSACGTQTQQEGAEQSASAKTGRKSSADAKSTKRKKVVEADDVGDVSDDEYAKAAVEPAQSGNQVASTATPTTDQQPTAQLAPTPQANPKVTGAKPDGGFFSRGAPTLSLAQITAGQQIAGKCEGGLHDLVIEPQHLQALAQGQTVQIKSSVHTHFGNPTVHGHSVTYTPIMG